MSGIAGGAEAILIPEIDTLPEELAEKLHKAYENGKAHAIVVVAEGANYNATALTEYFRAHRDRLGFSVRATILGHVQRGGAPSAFDRILASRLGNGAIEAIDRGEFGVLVGLKGNAVVATSLEEVCANKKQLNMDLIKLAQILD